MDGRRVAAYGGMLGIALGGFTWVVVAGNLVHQPSVSLAGALLAAGVWLVGGRTLLRYPARRGLVMGIAILFVVCADWALLGIVLPRVPEGGSIYVGTSRSAYAVLQPILIAAGLAGTGLVLWDLLFRRT
jgi:hypothetical protein